MGRTRERDNERVERKRNRWHTIKRGIGTRGGRRDNGREIENVTRKKERVRYLEKGGSKEIRDTTERTRMRVGEEEGTGSRKGLGRGNRVVWKAKVQRSICVEEEKLFSKHNERRIK